MKKDFFRIISPFSVFIAAVLDVGSVWISVFVIKDLASGNADTMSIIFAVMVVFAVILAVLFTKEIFSNGIIFYEDRCEFNAIDNDNVVYYKDIESIEEYKDTKASLRKGFNERNSLIIFNLKSDTVHTINIGFTTSRTLKKAIEKINTYAKKNG